MEANLALPRINPPISTVKQPWHGNTPKIQKHIEIVRSTTHGLSSLSQESCDAMYTLLKKHYALVGISIINTEADLEVLASKQPDLVFLGMKLLPATLSKTGAHIWISSYLEQRGIPHTGSGQEAIALERSKPLAKQCALDDGIKTSRFIVVPSDQQYIQPHMPLQYPLFVKPASLGGGQGIDSNSVVHTHADLQAKISSIQQEHGVDSLIEEYLPGREFSVGILKDEHSDELIAMPIELVAQDNTHGDRILTQEVKSSNEEAVLPVTDLDTRAQVIDVAIRVFQALGARDYGRIDIRLDATGVAHFLEANLIPSLISGYGSFPKACIMNLGLDYESMMLRIVRLGFARAPAIAD